MKVRATAWSRLGQNATFGGVGLMEVVKDRPDIQFVTADVSSLLGLKRYKDMYPLQYVDVGIAEQNMVTVAAGMAYAAGAGGSHLGGGLSCVEILTALYGAVFHTGVRRIWHL